jgi:type IV pilus assembly protein PilW
MPKSSGDTKKMKTDKWQRTGRHNSPPGANMKTVAKDGDGFTLVELMVAMVVSLVVLSGIYAAYRKQAGIYVEQEQVVEMQQNIRNAMYYLQRSLRMSGFDPQRTGLMGFVTNFDAPYHTLGATTDASNIAFALDSDEDGDLDTNELELVAYRLNGDQLQKLTFASAGSPPAAAWETVAENVDALDFVYLDDSDPPNVLAPPLNAVLDQIRSVQITLVARAGDNPSALEKAPADNRFYLNQQGTAIFNGGGDHFHRLSLTAQVNCRNIGL